MKKRKSEGGQVVTIGEIAKMAGVGPSAVSNWRKRRSDFPAPVQEAPGGDLFSRREVEAWLEKRPRYSKTAGVTRESGASSAQKREKGGTPELPEKMKIGQRLTQGRLLTWIQLLYLHHCLRRGTDPTGGRIRFTWDEILRDPEAGQEAWGAMVQAEEANFGKDLARALAPAGRVPSDDLEAALWIDQMFGEEDTNHGHVADLLLTIQENTRASWVSALTSAGVANLALDLLSPLAGTLYDPAFGMGAALAFAQSKRGDENPALCGQEISLFNWKVTFLRMKLHGAEADLRTGDTLLDDQFRSLKADRIVVDPPWGGRVDGPLPPDDRWPFLQAPRNSEWLWIHHTLFHLSDRGRAVALIPSGLALRAGSDKEERARILKADDLDAVIDLPPGVMPGTGVAPTLLLFDRQRTGRRGEVLFLDARRLGTSRRGKTRVLGLEQQSRIVSVVNEWREGSFEAEARFSGSASLEKIEEQDGVWTPSRYIGYVTRFKKIDGEPLGRRLDRLLGETGPGVPNATVDGMLEVLRILKGIERRTQRPWKTVRLGELFAAPPETGSREDLDGEDKLRPFVKTELLRDVAGAIEEVPKDRTRGNVGSRVTQAGDLLMTSRGIDEDRAPRCVRVEVAEPLAYSESLMRLRLQVDTVDPDYLRLFLTSQEGHMALAAVTSGTTISNIRPDALANLEVPLPNLSTQRQIAAIAGQAEGVVAQLEAFSERIRDLSKTLHEGLISGVFRVDRDS